MFGSSSGTPVPGAAARARRKSPRRWARWALTSLCCLAASAGAQTPAALGRPNLNIATNGQVLDIVRLPDGSVVFGGNFSSVNGTPRSYLAKLRPDGTLDPTWNPAPDNSGGSLSFGTVSALAADAAGDVYVGGTFTHIGGQARQNLAKLSGSGSGAADAEWNPSADGYVRALALDRDGALYAGGGFGRIGGQSRASLAKLSATAAGTVDPLWDPAPDGTVSAIWIDPAGSVYAGGWFTSIGGQSRRNLAKLSVSGPGAADAAWNPRPNRDVAALVGDAGGHLYVAGSFSDIGAQPRTGLARLLADGRADATWNPRFERGGDPVFVDAIALDADGRLYAGGGFTTVDGDAHACLVRLAASGSGAVDSSWNVGANDHVSALATSADRVYAGGIFGEIGGAARLGFAVVSAAGTVGAAVDAETPPQVNALWRQPDGGLIVGGAFQKADGLPRKNLLRVKPDGTLDTGWNPAPDDVVLALGGDGAGNVYAGGAFLRIGGLERGRIAKLAGSGGAVDPAWNPSADDSVAALAADGAGNVYVGGAFGRIGGAARNRLARLAASGLADPSWAASADRSVVALALTTSGTLYVGGYFSTVGGEARSRLARLSVTGAVDTSWNPSPDDDVGALALDAFGNLFVGGAFSRIGGQARDRIAKLSAGGSADANWNASAGDAVNALVVDAQGDVYAAGFFQHIGGTDRDFVAKLLPADGAADPDWNPGANSGIAALAFDAAGNLVAGGSFDVIGGQRRKGLAALPSRFVDPIFADGFDPHLPHRSAEELP
ncbi:delta-60 repeat domain-containing protein [Dokdonella sp.]|uniref:delta-60 repeat domain-containing protein n=1 Tax=Dokdonella sp. TaxID=2291710 RepID=UPI001B02F4CA|nr:delta-60 repeat domain-containing protein [Dokdonella sp.]MBO9661639.1 delta-60 repeat domain-containing protein [Dokdonella sp.]